MEDALPAVSGEDAPPHAGAPVVDLGQAATRSAFVPVKPYEFNGLVLSDLTEVSDPHNGDQHSYYRVVQMVSKTLV